MKKEKKAGKRRKVVVKDLEVQKEDPTGGFNPQPEPPGKPIPGILTATPAGGPGDPFRGGGPGGGLQGGKAR